MDELIQGLVSSGVSEKEAKLYVLLLKSGSSSIPMLYKKLRLPKVQGDKIVSALEGRGLVERRTLSKKTILTAADPKLVLQSIEKDEKQIVGRKEQASKLIEPLRLLGAKSSTKPQLHFFVDIEGVRAALDDTLSAKEKTIRAFFSMADLAEFVGGDYLEEYSKRRVSAGLNLQAIRTFERDKRSSAKPKKQQKYLSSKEERLDVRFVSEDLAFPMTLFLYDQKLLAISSRAENFAFVIESKELCQLQKKLFELSWKSIAIRSISSPTKS